MSARSKRRTREATARSESAAYQLRPTPMPPAYRKRSEVPEGKCWICGDDDHRLFAIAAEVRDEKGRTAFLDRADVANAQHHILAAAFGPITDRHEVNSAEWLQAYANLAAASGHLIGSVEYFARAAEFQRVAELATAAATEDAISVFFEELMRRGGEGVYHLELRRDRPGPVTPVRIH